MRQSRRARLRTYWDVVKDDIVYRAVKAKYEQNPMLALELIKTQGPIEAAEGAHWQEVNSRILERVRRELQDRRDRSVSLSGQLSKRRRVTSKA